jgi:putative ABC transport system permease protein
MISNYLTIAVRNLTRHKLYSLINVFGLSVGMAACIVALLFIQHELSFDTSHDKADRILETIKIR